MTNVFLLALFPDVFVDRTGGNDHDGLGLFFLTDAVNALVSLEEVLQVRGGAGKNRPRALGRCQAVGDGAFIGDKHLILAALIGVDDALTLTFTGGCGR